MLCLRLAELHWTIRTPERPALSESFDGPNYLACRTIHIVRLSIATKGTNRAIVRHIELSLVLYCCHRTILRFTELSSQANSTYQHDYRIHITIKSNGISVDANSTMYRTISNTEPLRGCVLFVWADSSIVRTIHSTQPVSYTHLTLPTILLV